MIYKEREKVIEALYVKDNLEEVASRLGAETYKVKKLLGGEIVVFFFMDRTYSVDLDDYYVINDGRGGSYFIGKNQFERQWDV